jgi:hypothetical protein
LPGLMVTSLLLLPVNDAALLLLLLLLLLLQSILRRSAVLPIRLVLELLLPLLLKVHLQLFGLRQLLHILLWALQHFLLLLLLLQDWLESAACLALL